MENNATSNLGAVPRRGGTRLPDEEDAARGTLSGVEASASDYQSQSDSVDGHETTNDSRRLNRNRDDADDVVLSAMWRLSGMQAQAQMQPTQESTDADADATTTSMSTESNEEKHCWVCYATEEDDATAPWVHPCRCRGATKWVHQACISRWVDEKQKGNSAAEVKCPQCNTVYTISFPKANLLVAILDLCDKGVLAVCPIIAGAVCVGSVYWTCVTYGAVSLMQTVGQEDGMEFMKRRDPLVLLCSLPLVPLGLILGKMVRWQEPLLRFLRRHVPKIPLSRFLLPLFQPADPASPSLNTSLPPVQDAVSATRTFCGALLFPFVASFCGNVLFAKTSSQFRRTCMGGITFVALKGVVKVYHRQHTYLRQCKRVVKDFSEEQTEAERQLAEAEQEVARLAGRLL